MSDSVERLRHWLENEPQSKPPYGEIHDVLARIEALETASRHWDSLRAALMDKEARQELRIEELEQALLDAFRRLHGAGMLERPDDFVRAVLEKGSDPNR